MTLLDFARGPGLQGAWLIMVAGTAWRVSGILLLRQRSHLAAPRIGFAGRVRVGLATVFTRFVPRRTFWPRIAVSVGLSSTFHLGLTVIVLGGAPHIQVIVADAAGNVYEEPLDALLPHGFILTVK